jgi:hypothetical protein
MGTAEALISGQSVLPGVDKDLGPACHWSATSNGPLVSLFLLPLIVMPLDGEEHARAQHENLEQNEDYREPIHHFEYFQAIT